MLLEALSASKFVMVCKIVKKFSCIWTLYCLLKIWGKVWESSGQVGNSFVSRCWKSWWLEELDCVIEWQNRLRLKWIFVLIIVSFDSKRLRDIVHISCLYDLCCAWLNKRFKMKMNLTCSQIVIQFDFFCLLTYK